jgi:hypothetical protein
VHARIGRRNISAAFAGVRSATTITFPAPTSSATPRKPRGARIAAGSPMASK